MWFSWAVISFDKLFFFFFFLIIKTRLYWTSKDYTTKPNNPTKREAEPYIEGSKNDIRHGTRPYKEGNKIVQQKDNTKLNNNKDNNNNITTITTTTNNITTITPNDTKLVQNLEDYKSNHNKRCSEQQKVWSLDPSQANHWEVESDWPWQEIPCDSGVGALQKEEFWKSYPKDRVVDKISNWKKSPNSIPTKHPRP